MDLSQLSNDDLADLQGDLLRLIKGRVEASGNARALRFYRLMHHAARELRDEMADGALIQPTSGGEPTEE